MDSEIIGGIEIVKDTTSTPKEYQEISEAIADDASGVSISFSQLQDSINIAQESYAVISDLLSLSQEDIDTPIGQLLHRYITNNISLEEESKEVDYQRLGKNLFHALVQATDHAVSLVDSLVSKTSELIKDNTSKSEKVSAHIRDLIKDTNGKVILRLSGQESEYFLLKNKVDIPETISLYNTLLDMQNKDKSKLFNIEQLLRFEVPKPNDYKEIQTGLVNVEIKVPFPIVKEESIKKNLTRYIGPQLPKGYLLAATLPKQNEYDNLDERSKLEVLTSSEVTMVKTDYTNSAKDIEIELANPDLEAINLAQQQLVTTSKSLMILMRSLDDKLAVLRRHYREVEHVAKLNPTNVVMKVINDNSIIVNFVSRIIKEPLYSLCSMSQVTNKLLLSKLIKLRREK